MSGSVRALVQIQPDVLSDTRNALLADDEKQVVPGNRQPWNRGGCDAQPPILLLGKGQLHVLVSPCPVVGDGTGPQERHRGNLAARVRDIELELLPVVNLLRCLLDDWSGPLEEIRGLVEL